jgi:hypothetical protein
MAKQLVRRVPPVGDWPILAMVHGLPLKQREPFSLFLAAMEQVLLVYDGQEQQREQTPENPDKPRTWAVVLPADANGIGRPFGVGVPLYLNYFGERARFQRSAGFVFEKTTRLAVEHETHGHIASSQSQDPSKDWYGGSLWLDEGHHLFQPAKQLAMSGLPGGDADDAGLMVSLEACGSGPPDWVEKVVQLTNNEKHAELRRRVILGD